MVRVSPGDSGAAVANTVISVQPSPLRPAAASATPSVARASATTASARSAGAITVSGWELRSGYSSARVRIAVMDSGRSVKESSCLRSPPRLRVPRASAPRSTAPPARTVAGRRAAEVPMAANSDRRALGVLPKAGISGQKTRRPSSTRTAGSRVVMATSAASTPIMPTGPMPRLLLRSAASRHSSPAATVPEEARIAGPLPRRAARMASYGRSWRRSSSR